MWATSKRCPVKEIAMLAKRIIPCLDVTAGRVVKGVNFLGLRDAGDPGKLPVVTMSRAQMN